MGGLALQCSGMTPDSFAQGSILEGFEDHMLYERSNPECLLVRQILKPLYYFPGPNLISNGKQVLKFKNVLPLKLVGDIK